MTIYIYMLKSGEYRLYDLIEIDLQYIGWEKREGEVSYWTTKDANLANITASITNAKIKILAWYKMREKICLILGKMIKKY